MSILLLIVLYFVPIIIAGARGHPNGLPIAAVNILLGWSILGWIVAFVWSLTAINKPAGPALVMGESGEKA